MDQSPHTSNYVNVNGIRLHYLDWGGSGPELLFLPGRGCNGHIFDDFSPRFTGGFHVLALDRRGHGDSDHPETGYDIDTLVEDLRGFNNLQIERAILAGHSLADIELCHFAACYPQRILKLVFLDAAYNYTLPGYKTMMERNPGRKIIIPGADRDYYSLSDYADFIKFAYPSLGEIWGALLDEHLRHEVIQTPEGKVVDKMPESVDKAIGDTVMTYVPEYSKIQAPTLCIYTVKEKTYYISTDYMSAEQQAALIEFFETVIQPWNQHCIEQVRRDAPHSNIVEIPDGHHYVFIPQADEVFKEMMEFLLENPT